jgi:hypothetical protein
MLFRRRRPESFGDGVSLTGSAAGGQSQPRELQTQEWRAWRRAEQRLVRAWHEWLASDDGDREIFYRRYLDALDGEKHAADVLESAVDSARARADVPSPMIIRGHEAGAANRARPFCCSDVTSAQATCALPLRLCSSGLDDAAAKPAWIDHRK